MMMETTTQTTPKSSAPATALTRPCVITISASDSLGLAGVQADNRALESCGVHGMNILSATTAQNNERVISVNAVDPQAFSDQWLAVDAARAKVIKCGLIATTEQLQFILDHCHQDQIVVWDPVITASSRASLVQEDDPSLHLAACRRFVARCDLITPNVSEAQLLSGISCNSIGRLADSLHDLGAKAVVITGGVQKQIDDENYKVNTNCYDYFSCTQPFNDINGKRSFWLASPTIVTANTRGTGCQLASLAAAELCKGNFVEDAVVLAKTRINCGLIQNFALGNSETPQSPKRGSLGLKKKFNGRDLPQLLLSSDYSSDTARNQQLNFPYCHLPDSSKASTKPQKIGLYPVVDSCQWVELLSECGVSTIQIRIKDANSSTLRQELDEAIKIARHYNVRLFINDHWQLALELGAYGVHLGQEDIEDADLVALSRASIRLGISTHSYYELCHALSLRPSYIALGPVYPTDSKLMPWQSQGLERLTEWINLADACKDKPPIPVVAIGGIDAHRLGAVAQCTPDGIAMISAITTSGDPKQTIKKFKAVIEREENLMPAPSDRHRPTADLTLY